MGFEHAKLSLRQGTHGFADIHKPTGTHMHSCMHVCLHTQSPGKKKQRPEIKHCGKRKQELLDHSVMRLHGFLLNLRFPLLMTSESTGEGW